MISQTLLEIFSRDIRKLKDELNLYPDEASLWTIKGDVRNSAGTLALHLAGNLRHFIGAVLGKTGYVRERDKEFSERYVPREVLLKNLEEAGQVVEQVLKNLPDQQVMSAYPLDNFGKGTSTLYVLAQLIAHFEYHLGQINYHRRLI